MIYSYKQGRGMTSSDIIKKLKKDGWTLKSVRGSHHKFEKGGRTVIVPHPKKHVPVGTAHQILKQAGLKQEVVL
jgi:predicted RNA binding protein YcfA (HicA-like mRNA interferase family)